MGIAAIAGVVGAGAAVYSASQAGKGGGGGGGYMPYLPQYSGNADALWLQALQSGWDLGTGVPGNVSPLLQQGLNYQSGVDPRAYQGAGQAASMMYPGIANQDLNSASILQALAGNAIQRQGDVYGAGQNIWQTALDPQNALRDRTQHLLNENVRAGESARGLAMTPYGAGIENKANSDFLLDWNNQQLQRQATGLQGLTSANLGANQSNQLAGQDLSGMMGFLNAAPQALLQGGYTPLQVGQNIGQYYNNAAGGYTQGAGQALAVPAGLQGSIIPYLYAGQGASGNAFNQFNQNRAYETGQMSQGVQGAFQGINQFAQSPAGQSTNNWLQGLFGTGGGGATSGIGPATGMISGGGGGGFGP